MGVPSIIAEALRPVIDLVYPPRCPLCGEGLSAQTGLCSTCWAGLVIPGDPACTLCQRPFAHRSEEGTICAPCLTTPPRHDGIAAATLYNDVSRRLVLSFKHGRRISLARMLARLMIARIPALEGEWRIVPVPLHRGRLWQRGFNQSALLAREIAIAKMHPLIVDGLMRRKATPRLGGLGRKARARALSGAIAVNARHLAEIRGRNILLVDDVLTSGATSEACVAALKRAGAGRVIVSCFARVLDEALPG